MEKDKLWLKFIISGKAEDYLDYINAKNAFDKAVNEYSLFDGGTGDSTKQYR